MEAELKMAREPLIIIHEFGPAGYRRYLKGQRPGKFKNVDEVYGYEDDKKEKLKSVKSA